MFFFQLPNELFYQNELKPCADKMARESLCQWDKVQNKDFPVIFHGVQGQDLREGNSPSFFNPEEVSIVMKYVRELFDQRSLGIKPAQIGIISPYRRQVHLLIKRCALSFNIVNPSRASEKDSSPPPRMPKETLLKLSVFVYFPYNFLKFCS